LRPTNKEQARDEFEAGKNPIFRYVADDDELLACREKLSCIDFSLENVALNIITKIGYRKEEEKLVTGDLLVEHIVEYLNLLGVKRGEVEIVESRNLLSIANVLKPGKHKKPKIYLNPDSYIPESLLPGLCAHELGTHLLRMMNDDYQPWSGGNRKKFSMKSHIATEEGLATLNTLIASDQKSLFQTALNYWAVCQASRLSFKDLYSILFKFLPSNHQVFKLCCRVKRGYTDTSMPGACSLDQSYFKGAVDLITNVDNVDFELLYCGLVARSDLRRLKPFIITDKEKIRIPYFISNDLKAYKQRIKEIGKFNGII
jgi:hypothetical protein